MIASVLKLKRADLAALGSMDSHGLQKAVHSLFPEKGEQGRDFLFADHGGGRSGHEIVILSKRAPTKPPFGELHSQELPPTFAAHDRYTFEVVLNPTRRDSKTRKIVPVTGREVLKKWFVAKALKHGFRVEPGSLRVIDTGVCRFDKVNTTLTYNSATFTGKLRVTDRALFVKSFENGIGREKGLGFGLLQIVPM